VIEEARKAVIDAAVKHAREGENVVILGAPGSGKTTTMYAIWKELDEDNDTALVWDTKDVARTHENDGVILFSDDLPETRELAKAMVERDVRGVITTAREQDWSRLPIDLRSKFNPINLPNISDEVMTQIATKHLGSQGITYEKKVLPAIVESAQGSPIYVRYLVEEIGSEIKSGAISKLTVNRIKTAPKGMTDYVAGILARILFELDGTIYKPRVGALPVIKTLLCLADMPNYETHEVHLNQMFFALKQPSDSPGPFNAFKQYLSRDPRFFSLKFMHDTLADVLRGKVDHPVVGDIRLVAQEMGVAGRRKIESQALDDGWEHVKAEYEIDKAGGLELVLAYSYFATKNFGVDRIDPVALNLANQHLQNPISQGLFALTGPISEIPKVKPKSEVSSPKVIPAPSKTPESIPLALEEKIMAKIQAGGADAKSEDIMKDLSKLDELKKLGDIGSIVEKYVESALSNVGEPKKTSFELLEETLEQESVTPRLLTRRVLKACRRIDVLSETGRLTDRKAKGNLLTTGLERLVNLDYNMYLENLEEISEALANVLGEEESAKDLTRISEMIPLKELDGNSRKKIVDTYNKAVRRSAKKGDYVGMESHLTSKWRFLGFDTNDLSYASDEFGRLMKRGRVEFALKRMRQLNTYFGDNDIEIRIGMALQALKNLSKGSVADRNEFNTTIAASLNLFEDLVAGIESCGEDICQELIKSPTMADLCLASVTSAISLMDNYVKNSGKAVSAESVYPLLHEAIRPLVSFAIKILKQNGANKSMQALAASLNKIKGESSAKEAMLGESKSLLS
jgi:DNA polymerase III delta prime subunit